MGRACLFGCRNSGVVMHCFPNPEKSPERFKAWVGLVGGKLETQADIEYYRKKKVCSIHFTDKDRNRYKRLNALAVPSLQLCGGNITENSILPGPSNLENDIFNASANLTPSGLADGSIAQNSELSVFNNVKTDTVNISAALTPSVTTGISSNTLHTIRMEHSYSVISRQRRNKTIKDAAKHMSVKHSCFEMKPLFTKIKYLKSEICRLRKRCVTFKSRLHSANKMSSDSFNSVVQKMSRPAQLFISMQRQSRKKSKGRRFSLEEKILSLSLYKKSPKSYSLLYKYFTLPSSKAMKKLLSDIKLSSGINGIIFNKIKKTLRCKDVSDRTCSL